MDPAETCGAEASIGVEVVYSPRAGEFDCVHVLVPPGAKVRDAVQLSGMLERHAQIDLERQKLGIWGQSRGLDDLVRDGDRVEVYRPLTLDPKEARRRRQQGQAGAGKASRRLAGATDSRTR
jgi:uncharacterized protein